jgi:two-component system, NarL family, nitrate/nitrite response regulator NarL
MTMTANLTKRQQEIVALVAQGLTNKAIANQLGLTEGTVKSHLHNIYSKHAIPNRTTLALETK